MGTEHTGMPRAEQPRAAGCCWRGRGAHRLKQQLQEVVWDKQAEGIRPPWVGELVFPCTRSKGLGWDPGSMGGGLAQTLVWGSQQHRSLGWYNSPVLCGQPCFIEQLCSVGQPCPYLLPPPPQRLKGTLWHPPGAHWLGLGILHALCQGRAKGLLFS